MPHPTKLTRSTADFQHFVAAQLKCVEDKIVTRYMAISCPNQKDEETKEGNGVCTCEFTTSSEIAQLQNHAPRKTEDPFPPEPRKIEDRYPAEEQEHFSFDTCEIRIDPEDGKAYTFDDLRNFYATSGYSEEELLRYWKGKCTRTEDPLPPMKTAIPVHLAPPHKTEDSWLGDQTATLVNLPREQTTTTAASTNMLAPPENLLPDNFMATVRGHHAAIHTAVENLRYCLKKEEENPQIQNGGFDQATLAALPERVSRFGEDAAATPRPTHQRKSMVKASLLQTQASEVQAKDVHSRKARISKDELTTMIDTTIGIVITLNSFMLIVTFQYEEYKSEIALGITTEGSGWHGADTWFLVFEHLFNAAFVIECLLRVILIRCVYFLNWMNLFDFMLVVLSSIDLYLMPFFQADLGNASILRFVRLLKAVRALRVIRTLALFSELRILVGTIYSGCRSLLTAMILLGICMMVAGILVCQFVGELIQDDTVDFELRMWCYTFYGSALRAMYTMFEVTLSGCWPNYARTLIDKVSGVYAIFWLVYVTWVVFAILRIISAIFLKDTMEAANNDAEMMAQQQLQKREKYLNQLREVFNEADTSGDGTLNFDEFEAVLKNPRVKVFLQILGLEVSETKMLFQLMDDGDGEVTVSEFMLGVSRLKGQSKSVDVHAIKQEIDAVHQDLCTLIYSFQRIFGTPVQNGAGSPTKVHLKQN